MSKLTNQETARAWQAMGQQCTISRDAFRDRRSWKSRFDVVWSHNNEDVDISHCKLVLTPLPKITDEHAKELVRLRSPIYLNLEITDQHRGRKEWGFTFHFEYASSKRRRHDDIGWKSLTPLQFQFMVAKGYAVPLYFGIDHPCNGMDAITLGIALDKTTLKCTSKC